MKEIKKPRRKAKPALKNRHTQFWLCLFIGPFGLLYSNVLVAVILTSVAIALYWTIIIPILFWIIAIILGDGSVNLYNQRIIKDEQKSLQRRQQRKLRF